jgi:uncharacterized protein YggU (UPF0235/DUF167 family)
MYARMHVVPGAGKEGVEVRAKDSYIVAVREPAERNLANRSALRLLAGFLKLPSAKIRLIRGHHRPGKIVSIDF